MVCAALGRLVAVMYIEFAENRTPQSALRQAPPGNPLILVYNMMKSRQIGLISDEQYAIEQDFRVKILSKITSQ